jgi:hypothetical protein
MKRRHLRQEVVDELDQELPLVDVETDKEDAAEPAGDFGPLPI